MGLGNAASRSANLADGPFQRMGSLIAKLRISGNPLVMLAPHLALIFKDVTVAGLPGCIGNVMYLP
jgi:hypothetical protein